MGFNWPLSALRHCLRPMTSSTFWADHNFGTNETFSNLISPVNLSSQNTQKMFRANFCCRPKWRTYDVIRFSAIIRWFIWLYLRNGWEFFKSDFISQFVITKYIKNVKYKFLPRGIVTALWSHQNFELTINNKQTKNFGTNEKWKIFKSDFTTRFAITKYTKNV